MFSVFARMSQVAKAALGLRRTAIFLVAAAVPGLTGPAALAQQANAQPSGWRSATPADPANPEIAAAETGHYTLDSGDKLRVHVYQRDDLSGEFTVDSNGTISIPLLGTFKVAGHDETELRQDISNAAQKIMERGVDVIVEVEQRRPIYIVGFVERPGVYPFALGMTVTHGISLAGGIFRPPQGGVTGKGAELTKELGQIELTRDTLKRDIVRLARLRAMRVGKPFDAVPPELEQLTGQAEARELMDNEIRLQISEQEAVTYRQAADKRSLEYAEDELRQLKSRIAQIDTQINLNTQRKLATEKLVAQGFVRKTQVAEIETNDATLNLTRIDAMANITRATRSVEDLKTQVAGTKFARDKEIDVEISSLSAQIEQLQSAFKTSNNILVAATGQDAGASTGDPDSLLSYSIMRRSEKGNIYIIVDDVAPLLPGDVLRVTLGRPQPVVQSAAK